MQACYGFNCHPNYKYKWPIDITKPWDYLTPALISTGQKQQKVVKLTNLSPRRRLLRRGWREEEDRGEVGAQPPLPPVHTWGSAAGWVPRGLRGRGPPLLPRSPAARECSQNLEQEQSESRIIIEVNTKSLKDYYGYEQCSIVHCLSCNHKFAK